jgi:hypothetical protein
MTSTADLDPPDVRTTEFYRSVLDVLQESGPPFLIGGAYALASYTGIARHTKDLDLFVRPADAGRALQALEAAGWRTEVAFTHWLGKVCGGEDFIDIIHSSGNALCPVDDGWFAHGVEAMVLGRRCRLCPAEEMLWQKAFIQERERFDGTDVAHLIRARGRSLDWARLLDRFGPHWPVLFGHVVAFCYIYPSDKGCIPASALRELTERWQAEAAALPPREGVCRGVLLSRAQYLPDLERGGYADVRAPPEGDMSAREVKDWTDAALGQGNDEPRP